MSRTRVSWVLDVGCWMLDVFRSYVAPVASSKLYAKLRTGTGSEPKPGVKFMKWSWRLLNVAGIGIYIHVTFFILLIWIGWSNFLTRHRWDDALSGIAFILTLFVVVV